MSTTSIVTTILDFTGDFSAQLAYASAENSSSPGDVNLVTLSSGNNSITVPAGATAVTLLPPPGNTAVITLKGVNGDTGITLHSTNPATISLSGMSTFVLTASVSIAGFRLIWS